MTLPITGTTTMAKIILSSANIKNTSPALVSSLDQCLLRSILNLHISLLLLYLLSRISSSCNSKFVITTIKLLLLFIPLVFTSNYTCSHFIVHPLPSCNSKFVILTTTTSIHSSCTYFILYLVATDNSNLSFYVILKS